MYISPIALADSVLTEAERRSGCALVDLGADTTTVSVYSKNILRHLAVIPLGSNNITKDIASLQMEEADAEKMKLKYASAYTENADIDNNLQLPIDGDRSVDLRKFIEIVESRLEEIVANVWYQVPAEYSDKLLGGIILTGGGSNMKNIDKAFTNHTHIDKIRIAKFVNHSVTSSYADINAKNGMMNTILGLLIKGDRNCAGGEVDPNNIFSQRQDDNLAAALGRTDMPRKQGVVPTEAEKRQQEEELRRKEEEARRKKEEEERQERERQEEEARRLAQERKENSPLNKGLKWFKRMTKKLTEEE